jgi:hypothetical protein
MDLLMWIAIFAANSLFWAWIVFWDGAEWLEGSFLSGLLLWFHAPAWPAQGIRLFAAGTWACQTIWFVVGLFSAAVRLFGP